MVCPAVCQTDRSGPSLAVSLIPPLYQHKCSDHLSQQLSRFIGTLPTEMVCPAVCHTDKSGLSMAVSIIPPLYQHKCSDHLSQQLESFYRNSTNRDGLSCCVSYRQIRTITGCINSTTTLLTQSSDHLSQQLSHITETLPTEMVCPSVCRTVRSGLSLAVSIILPLY